MRSQKIGKVTINQNEIDKLKQQLSRISKNPEAKSASSVRKKNDAEIENLKQQLQFFDVKKDDAVTKKPKQFSLFMNKITKGLQVHRGTKADVTTNFFFTDKQQKLVFEFDDDSVLYDNDLFEMSYKYDFKTKERNLSFTNKKTKEKKIINVELLKEGTVWFRLYDTGIKNVKKNSFCVATEDESSKEYKRSSGKVLSFFEIFFRGKIAYSFQMIPGKEFVLSEKNTERVVAFAQTKKRRNSLNPFFQVEIGENVDLCFILAVFFSFYSHKRQKSTDTETPISSDNIKAPLIGGLKPPRFS